MSPVVKLIIVLLVLVLIGLAVFLILRFDQEEPVVVPAVEDPEPVRQIIGQSVEGREIEAFTYGDGETRLLFVGGIHGGYEWNSVLLAYEFLDYFDDNPEAVPDHLQVTIVPSINPDGLYQVTGRSGRFVRTDIAADTVPGRFNANVVDLNRNFDCKWQPESTWRGEVVSAGTEAFSEPEARALKDLVLNYQPEAVVFWHSQAEAVYASECEDGILPETVNIMNAYAEASGYRAIDTFDAYAITGDAEGWLASLGIPAITVELKTHEDIEWERNLAGVKSLFNYYSL